LICINAELSFTFDCPFAERETPMSTTALQHRLTAGLIGLACGIVLASRCRLIAASPSGQVVRLTAHPISPR